MRTAACILLALLAAPALLHALTIETVPIGNPGNAADSLASSAGAVGYEYEIGKYEVTNAQYAEFLNAVDATGTNARGLYNSQMTSDARGGIDFAAAAPNGQKYSVKSGRGNNPVVFVSFYDAARFTNWLHNGQGPANTEDGAYLLTGGTPTPANAFFVERKVTASWCVPTYDEWYKAAFHKNDGVTANYFDYPTSSNTAPFSDQPPGTTSPDQSNSANFLHNDNLANGYNDGYAATGSPVFVNGTNYLTNVGAYPLAASPYGTFDQGGNVWDWTETDALEGRRVGGGSWINAASFLSSSASNATVADSESYTIGFRVARVEPGVLPGDYNLNGTIDAADYTIWRDTLGSTTDLRANGDNSGASANKIDQADYDFWKAAFSSGSAGALAVPEPTSLALVVFAMVASLAATTRPSRSPLAA